MRTQCFRIRLRSSVERQGVTKGEGLPLVCPIAIQVGEVWFPEKSWDDFAVVILGWWLEELRTLERTDNGRASLLFMDGPFEVRIFRVKGDLLTIECINRSTRKAVVRSQCSLAEVKHQVHAAASRALQIARNGGKTDGDCARLEALLMDDP
jgi:hypothetical protein